MQNMKVRKAKGMCCQILKKWSCMMINVWNVDPNIINNVACFDMNIRSLKSTRSPDTHQQTKALKDETYNIKNSYPCRQQQGCFIKSNITKSLNIFNFCLPLLSINGCLFLLRNCWTQFLAIFVGLQHDPT